MAEHTETVDAAVRSTIPEVPPAGPPAVLPACEECGGTCGDTGSGSGGCGCGGGGRTQGYLYAIGTVTARFPSLDIEKEFMQAWGKSPAQTLTIGDADKFAVLSQGQNLYLARQMCWIFQSGDIDLFILKPRSQVELTDLVTCLAPTPNLLSFALVVGSVGAIAPPSMCNGVQLPVAACEQVFSFTGQAFINSIVAEVRNDTALVAAIAQYITDQHLSQSTDDYIAARAGDAFSTLTLLSDNTGQTDEHRAINYLTFKSLALYKKVIEREINGFRLNSVTARPDPLARTRRIQDVVLLFTKIDTQQVARYFTRIDVTGQFPFLLNELAQFFDHP
ncbi:cyanobactin maturation protease PatG family protein [Streptomyces mirabilis]|uniref:cyanobactin maturation protease PatG family protein n=1 Tax=Streptomyces mirabilis TaxID=68239 RepID=UPI00367E150E